ncbi:MAG: electron transfer flavoprotein subunit alpha [Elusimicrobia bacterium]|nr:electron transfer flavoprotein subunit alpha [Elusimicrobiota bacterium]
MANIRVQENRCTGCGQCVPVCPVKCITLGPRPGGPKGPFEKMAVIDTAACTLCKACVSACRALGEKSCNKDLFSAIEIQEAAAGGDFSAYRGVWCVAETRRGQLSPTALELLNIGAKLAAALKEPLCAVLAGHGVEKFAAELAEHGAEQVYVIDAPELKDYLDEPHAAALAALINAKKPNKVIFPATTMGRTLSARAAILANTGLTADATELDVDAATGLLRVTRPTFGGNLMATITCRKTRPEMCSLRPLTYPKAEKNPKPLAVERFTPEAGALACKSSYAGFVSEESGELDIGGAEVIVAGGRGVGGPEGFKLLHELAQALGAAVGASRAAVDSGWVPYRHQVGLTGKTVKPKLYIACGISGQVQHMAGMSSSDIIVAINKDPDCPLMKQAAYAIEGDLYEVVPELIKTLKNPS